MCEIERKSGMGGRIKDLVTGAVQSHCGSCRLRAYAEKKPDSLISRLWRWHRQWCPAWKLYEKKQADESPDAVVQ